MSDPRKLDSIEAFRPREAADFTEVALTRKAEILLEAFHGRMPTGSELLNISEELGVELATAVYIRALQESNTHGSLIRKLRAFELNKWSRSAAGDLEVAVVASNFFHSGRRWGDHVEPWRNWARELGFKTASIDTDPQLSVAANARVILEFLRNDPDTPRLIVSYGQGSAEMRYLLQRRVKELENVRGWISVCGACDGLTSSQIFLEDNLPNLFLRLRMKLAGRNPITLTETSPDFPFWQNPMPVPKGMAVISIVGVPYRWQVAKRLRRLYDRLSVKGPNDGLVSIFEAAAYPSLIVPLGGLDHRASDIVLEPVLKRLFAVLAIEHCQVKKVEPEKEKGPGSNPGLFELICS